MKTTATLASLVIAVTSCVGSPDEDGRDDSFNDGKADSGKVAEGSRQAKGVLRVANEVSLEVLREDPPDGVGLADRPVDNIGDVRLGDDGTPGTADDGRFDTLAELDAVPFVGPIAFKKLLAYAEANGFVPHGTIVNGTSDVETALVVYREGATGAWQPATIKSPTSFEIEVDGPYSVVAVCDDQTGITRIEISQLPDEGDVNVFCGAVAAPGTNTLSGHMVQAGRVVAGGSQASSFTADWDFSLALADGTYDVVATTADAVAIRRGAVVAGNQALVQAIDVAQEALPFVTIPLSAVNATPGETLKARVFLRPQTNSVSATVFNGAPAMARVVLPTALLATDRQRAELRATEGKFERSLTRAVEAGADPNFTLPARLPTPQWTTETGELQVRFAGVPEGDNFYVDASTTAPDGRFVYHDFEVSHRFVVETGLDHATLDTNVPGFKPEWLIDFSAEYSRSAIAFASTGGTSISEFREDVNSPTARVAPARVPATIARRLER